MYKYKAKVLKVIDGDTVDLLIDLGFGISYKQRIRLLDYEMSALLRQPRCSRDIQAFF